MSEFFKDKRKFGLALGAVFMAITLAIASFAISRQDIAAMVSLPEDTAEGSREWDDETAPTTQAEEESWPERDGDPVGEEEPESVYFNVPSEMKGSFLVPGTDFLTTRDTSEAAIKAEVDKALANAKELDINSIIVDTVYGDLVIYQTKDAPELSTDFDILGYILDEARELGFYTYAIFDASLYESRSGLVSLLSVGAGTINKLSSNLEEFAAKYALDGILIDGYATDESGGSYTDYVSSGGGIGFDNFLRQSPAAIVKTAAKSIRKACPGTQVGLLADAVWENQSSHAEGSATTASYTSLSSGNADTKSFVEKGYVDFVAVKAYTTTESPTTPFDEVVTWWAGVARQNDISMYVVHATNGMLSDDAGADQLIRQLAAVEDTSGARGSIFNSLQPVAASGKSVTENIKKVSEGQVEPEQVLTQLEMTKPAQTTYTTADPQVTFTGASDPDQPVTINGEKVTTDESGYFTTQEPLRPGLNTFTVKHKDKTFTYNITRKIEVLKSASPMDNIVTDGGMTITITATAYQDADVYATIGGAIIPMELDSGVESEQDRDGFFRSFMGEYTVPVAGSVEQNLGRIVVYAEYEGEKDSIQAASVKVNKKAQPEDGSPIRVVADQAQTYPPNTLNNVPDSRYFPLPAGAMDYAVGEEIVYKKDNKTYTYVVLASGLRIETKDITAIEDDYPSNNAISGMTVNSESGYTYVTLKTAQKVSYSVSYAGDSIGFQFHNTTGVPADMALSKNPLFTSAKWSDSTLTLHYAKANTFWGYRGYYDENGNLVLRFNNPPGSLSGARIAIDPGHGGRDIGASGFLADYPESVINKSIAKAMAAELESRGATVNLMNNDNIEGEARKKAAEKWNADLLISIHCNSAPNAKATGTEVYYFQGFSKTLASNLSAAVSGAYGTNNRGAKSSYYHVSLSSQMPSVLVECGFLTNKDEYEKLIKNKTHQKIAVGIADGISSTIKAKATGVSGSGSESTGSEVKAGDPGTAEATGATETTTGSGVPLEGVYIKPSATVNEGKTTTLVPSFYPEEITDAAVTWKSNDTSVATVDGNGKVTGKAEGTANITVTTRDGGHTSVCEVTVRGVGAKEIKVTGVELSESDITLGKGGSLTLQAEVMPDDATNTDVTWRSNKTSVATVSDSGKVTGMREGTAEITVTTVDGKFKATCNVTVTGQTAAESAASVDSGARLSDASSIQIDQNYYELNPGITMRLEIYSEFWEMLRGGDFTWKSDNTSIVTVDRMGNITAKKVGEATVTAKASGFETLEWEIYVTRDKIPVTGLGVSERKIEVKKGSAYNLSATFSPLNATNRNVAWSSANERIAKVDSSGKVTGVNPGTTTITVRSRENSKITGSCEVTVVSATSGGSDSSGIEGFYILYDGSDVPDDGLEFSVGDTGRFTYEYYPSSATDRGVVWESKTPNCVKIDKNGNFECLRKGSATIMVSLENNSRIRQTVRITIE